MVMSEDKSITKRMGDNLAWLLSKKILQVYPKFNSRSYIDEIKKQCSNLRFSERLELHADALRSYLPKDYKKSLEILIQIMGEENTNETGMFKEYYWLLPVGKFIEKYGLDNFSDSITAIEELTKRSTGEYAIRPFIKKDSKRTIKIMKKWAQSKNFHLRRLASEGLRPKLPWATKLETFIEDPLPVFEILELLKEDKVKFVKKSVANNLADYLKVNKAPTVRLINQWKRSKNIDTIWIIKHATRKVKAD
jgi:3-methyladenine DNA glycosylase AlkC